MIHREIKNYIMGRGAEEVKGRRGVLRGQKRVVT